MKTIDIKNQIKRIESEGKKKDLNFLLNSLAALVIGVYLYYMFSFIF